MTTHTPGPPFVQALLAKQEAQARLIAAAPDLLAALRQILTALEHHQHWKPNMIYHLTGLARAAIAKAEGKS